MSSPRRTAHGRSFTSRIALAPAACATLVVSMLTANAPAADTLMRVRVATDRSAELETELERAGFDVPHGTATVRSLDVVVSDLELEALRARGLDITVINRGRPFRDILAERQGVDGPPSGYMDYDAIVAEMTAIAAANPNIVHMVDVTTEYAMPTTAEGRHLYALKISDNPTVDEDEPSIMIVSAHHARELVTPVIALHIVNELVTQYPFFGPVQTAVNATEIWVAPVWNPDGYQYVFDVDNNWRKNRTVFPGGTGVDQNRNYPFGWDSACSGSTTPSSNTYKGPSAASEAETQTMMALSLDQQFDKVIDYHSSGQEVLWGYDCLSHPLDAWLQAEAIALSNASTYNGDERPPSADGEHYQWQLGALGAHAFLIETATSFQPSFADAQSEAAAVWGGVLYMLQRVIPLQGHVTDAVTGLPVEALVENLDLTYLNGEANQSEPMFGWYSAFYPNGSHEVQFSADGYITQSANVLILGGNVVLDVQLVPEGGIPGDLDGNGVVDFADVLQLLGQWGVCPAPPAACPADLSGNGIVDFADVLALLANWTT